MRRVACHSTEVYGSEYRKNKATFHASPPTGASPHLGTRTPAAGVLGRPPGRPRAIRAAGHTERRRRRPRARRKKFNVNEILYGAKKEADRQRDFAAEIGTAIHKWVEQFIKRQKPDMPDDPLILNGVNAFLAWKESRKVKFLGSEKIIYSKRHKYAGIIDILAEIDGEPCVVDIKTSNGIYDEMRLQVAAYMHAEQEESGRKYAGRWIIRLGKTVQENGEPDFEAVYLDQQKDSFKHDLGAFLHAVELYRWQKRPRV